MLQNMPTNDYHIYTDGSLNIKETDIGGRTTMGAGWILKNSEISFGCGISCFPSSTRPELLAIFTAILATPANKILNIYSDSQAAINGINNAIFNQHKSNKILRQHNYNIIYAIQEVITAKSITLLLHKVKGHSDDLWNAAADSIAKDARIDV